mmetsp:Transcript_7153/g.17439  ORF Transcript_7153/g.17439 Transcript_7153/m.17439 type:complete len:591 (+) Transcript_7153:226-1998(+)|eukprot:CAMPEP_0197186234 /NCGR_PEP_ID=MMETSP1423-20130617/13491_1 /TAXON_ID=476441 /ORGANISM="Pseudo-nitzschia heimii, Strain UNC1101" /LENGTH=590 /DNA_ID=CAMNT_0042637483 /DNA_START=164 /DNA_END=1936 /DNA_ORIENTATION=+
MNICDSNICVETFHQYSEKDSPPFALDDQSSSLQDEPDNTFDKISKSKLSRLPAKEMEIDSRSVQYTVQSCSKDHLVIPSYTELSSHSTPTDLTESVTTDGTSCCSVFSAPNSDISKSINQKTKVTTSPSLPRAALLQSSLVSTSSLTSILLEPRQSSREFDPVESRCFKITSASSHDPYMNSAQSDKISSSMGFSELMEAADDSNIELEKCRPATLLSNHRSSHKLPPLLENQEVESGALISAENQEVEHSILISPAPAHESTSTMLPSSRGGRGEKWWHMQLFDPCSHNANLELKRPLLNTILGTKSDNEAHETPHITRLLSSDTFQDHYMNLELKRVSESVQIKIEDEDSFEVSLLLQNNTLCTVDDVMDVISNTDLLNLWCNPIENIIVTSSSNEVPYSAMNSDGKKINVECGLHGSSNIGDDVSNIREYEAEWIEATTSSLESPSSTAGFILNAGHCALKSLGCASYGRITMFIERRHARVGLTIGPFHGGIHASHSIFVSLEDRNSDSRRIRIVDRVRLTRGNEEIFAGGILGCTTGSCLSHFFSPSIDRYVDQVTLSMARLRILLENRESVRSESRSCFRSKP